MARVSASQRTRPYLRIASLALVALTVLFTLSSVKHLASAIAARHSLANNRNFELQGHKLLSHDTDVIDSGRPHWLGDGSVQQAVSSVRNNLAAGECLTMVLSYTWQQVCNCGS